MYRLHIIVMKLLEGLEFIITHIKREENKEADRLVNETKDEEVG